MNNSTETSKQEIAKMQKLLREKHPNWPEDKARWAALKALNIIN